MPLGLPKYNHYRVREIPDNCLFGACGLRYGIDADSGRPTIAYCETEDIANMIADALNKLYGENSDRP